MGKPRNRSRKPVTMMLALTASACMTWRVEPDPLPAPLDRRTLPQIRILTREGNTIIVYEARLAGDSIIGSSRPRSDSRADRVSIGTDAVAQVEVRVEDTWKTFWTTTALVALTVAIVAIAAACQALSSV